MKKISLENLAFLANPKFILASYVLGCVVILLIATNYLFPERSAKQEQEFVRAMFEKKFAAQDRLEEMRNLEAGLPVDMTSALGLERVSLKLSEDYLPGKSKNLALHVPTSFRSSDDVQVSLSSLGWAASTVGKFETLDGEQKVFVAGVLDDGKIVQHTLPQIRDLDAMASGDNGRVFALGMRSENVRVSANPSPDSKKAGEGGIANQLILYLDSSNNWVSSPLPSQYIFRSIVPLPGQGVGIAGLKPGMKRGDADAISLHVLQNGGVLALAPLLQKTSSPAKSKFGQVSWAFASAVMSDTSENQNRQQRPARGERDSDSNSLIGPQRKSASKLEISMTQSDGKLESKQYEDFELLEVRVVKEGAAVLFIGKDESDDPAVIAITSAEFPSKPWSASIPDSVDSASIAEVGGQTLILFHSNTEMRQSENRRERSSRRFGSFRARDGNLWVATYDERGAFTPQWGREGRPVINVERSELRFLDEAGKEIGRINIPYKDLSSLIGAGAVVYRIVTNKNTVAILFVALLVAMGVVYTQLPINSESSSREKSVASHDKVDPLVDLASMAGGEMKLLLRRSSTLLYTGFAMSFLGLFLFYISLEELSRVGRTVGWSDAPLYLRSIGMLLFVEGLAVFLFRQYRAVIADYRYYYGVYLKREGVLAAREVFLAGEATLNADAKKTLIEALLEAPKFGYETKSDIVESAPAISKHVSELTDMFKEYLKSGNKLKEVLASPRASQVKELA
jgi:hypothetical protein